MLCWACPVGGFDRKFCAVNEGSWGCRRCRCRCWRCWPLAKQARFRRADLFEVVGAHHRADAVADPRISETHPALAEGSGGGRSELGSLVQLGWFGTVVSSSPPDTPYIFLVFHCMSSNPMQSPLVHTRKLPSTPRSCGPMDKAPVYGTGDSRFDPWQDHNSFFSLSRTWGDAPRRQLRPRKVSHRSEQCGGVGGRRRGGMRCFWQKNVELISGVQNLTLSRV